MLFYTCALPKCTSFLLTPQFVLKIVVDRSITQNEELKVACDYVIMFCNNKFKHMLYYLKHTTREILWKQQLTEKRLWQKITAQKYKVNSIALNLNQNTEKIIDGNPYFLCFCTASWFSKVFHACLLLIDHRNISYSRRIPLLWASHVLTEVTKVIEIRIFSSFFEVTNIICLKILSDFSQIR